ncbi:MAG: penicillin-binding transpeptidase domain-containing protein, partial [Chloroflexota bacterium]|nr:penicillin-binding transpeptidase domain-containing protein [Chloroflexota bacterium]
TVGKTGLESTLEPYLRGRPGAQEVEVTSTNRIVREGKLTEPVPGHNITLTLDLALQTQVEAALQRGMRAAGARSGAAVVLDPRSGDVLSLVTLPSYDNNAFVGGISQREYGALQEDPGNPLLNKAISGAYEPGAVLKPYVAAGGLAERIIDRGIEYPCAGSIEVPSPTGSLQRQIFKDSNARQLGPQNVIEALANDCDTFFYILAGPNQRDETGRPLRYYAPGRTDATPFTGLGIERINRYLSNFGFGKPTTIDLPGEAGGLLADQQWKLERFPSEEWSLTDTLRTSVGKGYTLVTPLQMATATAAVANGGAVYKPQMVLRITDPRGREVLAPAPEQMGTAGMTPDHLQTVREGMLRTTQTGVGATLRTRGLLPKGVRVGASMDSPTPANSKEAPPASWFTAFAPYERPEVAIAVLIDEEAGSQHAATVGAEVLKYLFETRRPTP